MITSVYFDFAVHVNSIYSLWNAKRGKQNKTKLTVIHMKWRDMIATELASHANTARGNNEKRGIK